MIHVINNIPTFDCWDLAIERMQIHSTSFWLRFTPLLIINSLVVFGNLLVVLSVILHKKLHTTTNYLITSLAVSDLLLGLFVLPFSIFFELSGQLWPFGQVWCQGWLAVDVWLCSASIYNLVAISYDRYMAVTRPIRYRYISSKRIRNRLVLSSWFLAAAICAPPLLISAVRAAHPLKMDFSEKPPLDVLQDQGFADRPNGTFLMKYVVEKKRQILPEISIGEMPSVGSECGCSPLNNDVGYILYSACGSFHIPMLLILYLNIGIFIRARKAGRLQTEQSIMKTDAAEATTPTATTKTSSLTAVSAPRFHDQRRSSRRMTRSPLAKQQVKGVIAQQLLVHSGIALSVTNEDADEITKCEPTTNRSNLMSNSRNYHTIQSQVAASKLGLGGFPLGLDRDQDNKSTPKIPALRAVLKNTYEPQSPALRRSNTSLNRQPTVSDQSVSNNISGSQSIFRRTFTRRSKGRSGGGTSTADRRSIRERRVAKTILVVIVCFIGCWLPFTVMYSYQAVNIGAIDPLLFAICFWLGYCNSALNPIIYALFSRELRKAFKGTLQKIRYCGQNSPPQWGNRDSPGQVPAMVAQHSFNRVHTQRRTRHASTASKQKTHSLRR